MILFSMRADDEDMRLVGNYVMYTGFGIVVPQLIYTIRLFAEIFRAAFTEKDPHDIYFE